MREVVGVDVDAAVPCEDGVVNGEIVENRLIAQRFVDGFSAESGESAANATHINPPQDVDKSAASSVESTEIADSAEPSDDAFGAACHARERRRIRHVRL